VTDEKRIYHCRNQRFHCDQCGCTNINIRRPRHIGRRCEDLEGAIEDDRERDLGRFGSEGREVGNYGSFALRCTAVSNDGESSTDLGLGLRYGWLDGINGFDVTANLSYAEDDGEKTKDTLLVGMDYRRDLNNALFAYSKLEAAFDQLADVAGDFTKDLFVGARAGYRIYSTADTQWSVQAGPGYRVGKRA
jgi:putative salt-induced outer membrane protein